MRWHRYTSPVDGTHGIMHGHELIAFTRRLELADRLVTRMNRTPHHGPTSH